MKLVYLISLTLPIVGCAQPKLRDDTATTREDTAVVIDVLANDSHVDRSQLRAFATTTMLGGSARSLRDGTFEFTPDADFEGTTGFDYVIEADGEEHSATVTVTVTPDSGPYERSELALPQEPQGVAVADFNGDGL